MKFHRIAAALTAAVFLSGCVSQATQQALTQSRLACAGGNQGACVQALVFQQQADQEQRESAAVGIGILGVLATGADIYATSRCRWC